MIEKINVKLLAVIISVAVIICIGIFIVVKIVNKNANRNYELEVITEEDYVYFKVLLDNKYGVIDRKGNLIIEDKYNDVIIPNPTKAVFFLTLEDGNTKVLNENGEEIFTEFNNVSPIETTGGVASIPYEKTVLSYEENGKYGLIDFAGNVITKAIYEEISSVKYKEGEILAKKDGKYGVINNKGVELISFEYDEIEADKYYSDNSYSNSGYIVKTTTQDGYRYGYISSKWEILLEPEYTSISRVLDIDENDIYLIVARNGQYGVVKNKNTVIDFAYQSIEYNRDAKKFAVERSEQFGVLDMEGKNIVNVEYKSISFNGIYVLAKSYTDEIYFDENGEKVENDYISMQEVSDARAYITIDKNNLYGIVNQKQEVLVKNEYLYIEYAFDKYFVAYKSGEGLGVIDREGNIYINFEYDVLSKISENNLLKGIDMENNTTDIFSSNMEKVLSMQNAIVEIHSGYVEVYNDEKARFITKEGVVKEAKDVLTENKLFAICQDGKWGFADVEGNIKVNTEYDYVTEFNIYGFAGIKKDNKWGVIDEEGNIICEPQYEFEFEEEAVKPEFIGKYFKIYSENGEMYGTSK